MKITDYNITSEKARVFKDFIAENGFTAYEYRPEEIRFVGPKSDFSIFLNEEILFVGRCVVLPAEEFLLVLYWLQFRRFFHLNYGT